MIRDKGGTSHVIPSIQPSRSDHRCLCPGDRALLGASSALLGVCGPFTDVAADAFCPFVLEIFYLGITTGTTPTTYDPTSNVSLSGEVSSPKSRPP
jgi:hypothetical protein